MEKMLAWNPNDNQGIRFIIGSDYLRSGMEDKAAAIFHAEGPHYPPYRYELGLLLFRKGRHQAPATSLRHGFVENGYVAEILCGTPDPLPLPIWHGSNFAEAELAQDYVLRYGDLWRRSPEAVTFFVGCICIPRSWLSVVPSWSGGRRFSGSTMSNGGV